MINYYTILEVREIALQSEIKAAYKILAKRYHPDLNKDPLAEEKFKLVNTAYSVLSNPLQRRKHDEQLAATRARQQSSGSYAVPKYGRQRQSPRYQYRRAQKPPAYRKSYSSKEDLKGTFYAFAFIAVVAVLVLSSVAIYNYVQQLQMEALVEDFEDRAESADSLYYAGKIDAAIQGVVKMKQLVKDESSLRSYEYDYLNFRKEQADFDYQNKAYKDALWGYLVYAEYTNTSDYGILIRMANCYRHTDKPHFAIKMYDQLMEENFKRIQMLNNIAEIYWHDLNNTDLAQQYYEIGLESVQKKFREVYGNAFRILVNGKNTPYSYKQIYWSLAQIYMNKSYYEAAIKVLEWVVYFEPEKAAAFQLLHDAYVASGDSERACKTISKAKEKSHIIETEQECV